MKLVMIYWYRKYGKGCVVNMKKLLQLFMVLALLVVPSMCFAQKTFPDGTVLNDKEELVYDLVERQSKYFVDPASIRFRVVGNIFDVDEFKNNHGSVFITLSAKNSMGGRIIKTYDWRYDGYELLSKDGPWDYQAEDIDCSKLNHLWKTYHADD